MEAKEANIVDLEQQKFSYRSALFEFVRDRAKALVQKQDDGEGVDVLWNHEKSTGKVLCTAHMVSMISDEEAKGLCSQINKACPMLEKEFTKEWQKNFGLM